MWATYGNASTEVAPPGLATHIVAQDGVYAWARAPWGEVRAPAALFGTPLLPWSDPVTPSVRLDAPPIPRLLLTHLLGEARETAHSSGHERLWFLTWRPGASWGVVTRRRPRRRAVSPIGTSTGRSTRSSPSTRTARSASSSRRRRDGRPHTAYLNVVIGDLSDDGPPGILCRASVCGTLMTVPAQTLFAAGIPAVDYALQPTPPGVPRPHPGTALGGRPDVRPGIRVGGPWFGAVPRVVTALLGRWDHRVGRGPAPEPHDHHGGAS